MTEEPKKSKGGSKLSRSEITTVRLDPKLRYLAELAARKQRRTLSSFIEWAIEDGLNRVAVQEWDQGQTSIAEDASYLWDVDAADRFARLAIKYPDLLTHEEQVLWKLVRENGFLWRGRYSKNSPFEWQWSTSDISNLLLPRLREKWQTFLEVAAGELPSVSLPSWPMTDPGKSGFDDMDDDIPF